MNVTPHHLSAAPFDRGYPGREGTYLHLHRGISRSSVEIRPARMIALGLAISLLWIALLPWAGSGWVAILGLLDGPGQVFDRLVAVEYTLAGRTVSVMPELVFQAPEPGPWAIAAHFAVCAAAFAWSFRLGEERAPLVYFLRALVLIHGTSVAFHAMPGRHLPYDPGAYVSGMLTVGISIMALVPIVLAATHYLFDFGLGRKLGVTAAAMGWLYLTIPVKYAVHAILLHHGGMIFLPILFILFGLPVEVFGFIAIYAWGMSWKTRPPSAAKPLSTTTSLTSRRAA